jgi:hypothetical protein
MYQNLMLRMAIGSIGTAKLVGNLSLSEKEFE